MFLLFDVNLIYHDDVASCNTSLTCLFFTEKLLMDKYISWKNKKSASLEYLFKSKSLYKEMSINYSSCRKYR